MLKLLWGILKGEQGGTLAITRKTANTLITAAGFNTNYDEIEAICNGDIDATNIEDDAITAAKLNSDVVRADYGLKQHTDGTLYVDVSDTTPGLEITDGGLRVKVDGTTVTRGASGLTAIGITDHGALTGLSDDDHTEYLNNTRHDTTTRHGSSVVDHGSIGGLTDNDHTQYIRGQSTNYKIDSGTVSAAYGATSVNFNFTFSSAPLVVIGFGGVHSDGLQHLYPSEVTATGFKVNNGYDAVTANWIAIGTAA
jgi:hypothetical protein